MNLIPIIFILLIIIIFTLGTRFLFLWMSKYRSLMMKIKKEGQFIYKKQYGGGLAHVRPVSEKDKGDEVLSYMENLGLIKFDRFMKYFAYYLGMSLFLGIIIAMLYWIKTLI